MCIPGGYIGSFPQARTQASPHTNSSNLFTLHTQSITHAPHNFPQRYAKNKKCPIVIGQEFKFHTIPLPDAQFQLGLELVHEVSLHRIGRHAVFYGLIGVNDGAVIAAAEMESDRLER